MTNPPLSPITEARRGSRPRSRTTLAGVALLAASAALLTACGGNASGSSGNLALSAPLPTEVPKGTVIRIGDPQTQVALEASGLGKELDAAGVKVKWANITGGPASITAFRADELDCSSVADIPSLFAHWTGTSTQIVFQSVTVDQPAHPTYKLGIAPGAADDIRSIADLKGKKIAYSAGQAQGALVLRVLQKAGLSQDDVKLVELESTGTTYNTALGSNAVDVAPLGAATIHTYLDHYQGSSAIDTGIRDDASTLYCLTSAVKDKAKAAALQEYVAVRTKALLWINDHREEWKSAYYEKNQGLSPEDAQAAVDAAGLKAIPATWDNVTTRLQETADLLAEEQDHPKFDVSDIVDERFAEVEAAAAAGKTVTGEAS
jgi:sulfonate transport system substrate-binding protein